MNDKKVVDTLSEILIDFDYDPNLAKDLWEELKSLDSDKKPKKKRSESPKYKLLRKYLKERGITCSIADLKRAFGNAQERRAQVKKDLIKLARQQAAKNDKRSQG